MTNKKYVSLVIALTMIGGFILAVPAFAQTTNPQGQGNGKFGGMMNKGRVNGIFGTVSAINGNVVTVKGVNGFGGDVTGVTYTVDAANAKVTKNNIASTLASVVSGDTVIVQGTVSGTNVTATAIKDGVAPNGARNGMGISGTVSAISGTTLTVTGKARAVTPGATETVVTYTVDASSSTVTKNGVSSPVSAIASGDTVMVQGTISGTNIVAKTIRDGVAQPVIQGNGQPVIAGSVTSINGNSIVVTNKSNVTYTIDTTNAKVVVQGVTSPTISNVAVGDNVIIQGAVNGTSVTASSVIDQKITAGNNSENNPKPHGFMGGMMNGIGNFFKKLFGF